MWHSSLALALAASAVGVQAGSLKDIKHIVLFMQENRAFDHVCLLYATASASASLLAARRLRADRSSSLAPAKLT